MVASDPEAFANAVSLVQANLRDCSDALDHLSDIAPPSDELLQRFEMWAAIFDQVRNAVRTEVRAELERIL